VNFDRSYSFATVNGYSAEFGQIVRATIQKLYGINFFLKPIGEPSLVRLRCTPDYQRLGHLAKYVEFGK
jgi:hypothetical protein